MKKNLLVFVLTLIASIGANAASINSNHRITGDISTSTEVDQFTFSVLAGMTVTFDVLAYEIYDLNLYIQNGFPTPSLAVDLNGNNQEDLLDSMLYLFDSAGNELASNDDMSQADLLSGADFNDSINFVDSLLTYTFTFGGIYTLAIADADLTGAEAYAGARTGGDTGGYVLDIIGDGPVTLNPTVSPVPVPAAAWLFGTALLGFVGLRRKKLKQAA